MTVDLRALRQQPFDLLVKLEERLRTARLDYSAGQLESWIGLGFRLGGYWLVAPREDVREVIPLPELTRVPRAKPWFLGLGNVRGNLLPVVDLAGVIGLSGERATDNGRVLVLNSDRVPVGFVVDEVAGYRQFAPADQRHALIENTGSLRPFLLGAFEREGRGWRAFSLHKVAEEKTFLQAGV